MLRGIPRISFPNHPPSSSEELGVQKCFPFPRVREEGGPPADTHLAGSLSPLRRPGLPNARMGPHMPQRTSPGWSCAPEFTYSRVH